MMVLAPISKTIGTILFVLKSLFYLGQFSNLFILSPRKNCGGAEHSR